MADAPLWQDPRQRHAFAFAIGRLAGAFASHPGAVGLYLRAHGWPAERWLEALAELGWLGEFGLALGVSAPQLPTVGLFGDAGAQLAALRGAGVGWLQVGEAAAPAWGPLLAAQPGPSALAWARSCHDLAGVERAVQGGAAWVSLSPLFATPSKPGVAGLGWAALEQAIALYPQQIVALGGIGPGEAAEVWRRGASAAVLRAWQEQPRQLAAAFAAAY